ncbi:sulfotransferase domain-containing protein [Alteromonas sp. NFXS44]|uniref:sulfotransferase domain-containing protein n=1 Tax=Alteromonas sp. NFXS44 TaxID=2818435 RepID=UPI0032E01789
MERNLLPNLLLAGAPKCGTTSVYDWLVKHPDISGAVDKELFYLIDKSDWKYSEKSNWGSHGKVGYSKYFKEDNQIMVDGTTLTIYQESALEFAKELKPKVLFFIREPSSRIFSTFKYFRDTRTVLPKNMSFSEFLKRVDSGDDFRGNNQLSKVIEQSRYYLYLNKWKDVLGEQNIRTYDFSDFKEQKVALMRDIAEWLNIDGDFYSNFDFTHKNETSIAKFRGLNRVKEKIAVKVKNKKIKEVIKPIYEKLNKAKPDNSLSGDDLAAKNKLEKALESDYQESLKLAKIISK